MFIINLFLELFRICIFFITLRYKAFPKIALLWLEVNYCRRYFKQHNIHYPFKPHEKHIIAEFYDKTKNALQYFSMVTPKTILSAWKNYLAKYWASFSKNRKKGRPPVSKENKLLILKIKKENPLWGSRRIRDELKKLSIEISHETISKILQQFRKTGDIKPTLSWKRFLTSHWNNLFSCDYLTVDIFGLKRFYVFFILELKTRKIVQHGLTTNPNIQFLRNQLSVFEYEYPNSTLIHDNSNELKWFPYDQYNIKDIAAVPFSPNMNAYAERFVRSIRQECLDYFIIFTEGQLRRLIKSYIDYYNNYRPHQGLKGIPNGPPEPVSKTGKIRQKPLVFGLHNHYYREAA